MSNDWSTEKRAYREIADEAPFMVWMTNLQGYCFYLNPEWTRFTGQPNEEAVGTGWMRMVHPDDMQGVEAAFYSALPGQDHYHVEYRLHRRDDGYRWVATSGRAHFSMEGECDGYMGSIYSIGIHRSTKPLEFTAREREVIELTAAGKTSDEIGTILAVSPRTVEFHMSGILLKTNSVNRVQAVVEAIKHGIIAV